MKTVKNYASIWNVSKRLYTFGDKTLPFSVTFSQLIWGIGVFFIVMIFGELPPLSFIDSWLIKYVGFPILISYLANQKTFDRKKPFSFFYTVICFALRPKLRFGYDVIKKEKIKFNEEYTYVRSSEI